MHTSGLVLELYDDVGGEQLKSFFPSKEAVPDFVKSAQALTPGDRNVLPDDVFALVMVNEGEKLRKYACVDEGNTALSVLYFIKNAHKLPDEARKVAAANLKVACGWYGLDVPVELEKAAGLGSMAMRAAANDPVGTAMTAMTAPALIRGTSQGIKSNLAKVHAGEAMGGVAGGIGAMGRGMERLASANLLHLKFAEAMKSAEVSGTALMPNSKVVATPEPAPAVLKKSGSVGHLVASHRGETGVMPEVGTPVLGKSPQRSPQHMTPHVDVSGKEPHREMTEKKASRFALPTYGRYPIDNYGQVKEASAYFEEYGKSLAPVDRHEYCVNLVKRAEELSIPVSDTIRRYGSQKFASAGDIRAALDTRRHLLTEREDLDLLDKVASVGPSLSPEGYACLLASFDESRGLQQYYDTNVMDPYFSTFGFEKKASEKEDWSDVVGNYHITKHELDTFALNHWMLLKKIFGMDFAEEFKKDPVGIYSSLPVEQKTLIIRMATENSPV